MKKLLERIIGFLLECLGNAVAFGLFGAVLFLPFGILGAVVTWDPVGLLMIAGFGGILGILMGIGQVFVNRFSEQSSAREAEPTSLGNSLLEFYLGPLKPSWWGLVEFGQKIIEKDYSKQKPGRWKLGFVGAVVCMLFVGLLFGAVAMTSPSPPAPGLTPWILSLIGIAGIAGGALAHLRILDNKRVRRLGQTQRDSQPAPQSPR